MKIQIRILIYSIFLSVTLLNAQTKTTKEAKVIVVITDNIIEAMEHFEHYRNKEQVLVKKYPKSKFFVGLLKGKYEAKDGIITLKNEAIIILYTEKQIFNNSTLFKGKKMTYGEQIPIGKTKGKIIAAKKGELVIKTNN